MTAAQFWEDFYAGRTRWSGQPNDLLVAEVQALAPGDALDLGCGEGGDAIWLAQLGWSVTAVDVSSAALASAAEHARLADVAHAIRWECHDLDATFPDDQYDLVTSCYLQSPVALGRAAILRKAAAAVGPGGHIVVIGHAAPPSWNADHDHGGMPSAAGVLDELDLGAGWHVERCADVEQPTRDPEGRPATRPDSVVHARRR